MGEYSVAIVDKKPQNFILSERESFVVESAKKGAVEFIEKKIEECGQDYGAGIKIPIQFRFRRGGVFAICVGGDVDFVTPSDLDDLETITVIEKEQNVVMQVCFNKVFDGSGFDNILYTEGVMCSIADVFGKENINYLMVLPGEGD